MVAMSDLALKGVVQSALVHSSCWSTSYSPDIFATHPANMNRSEMIASKQDDRHLLLRTRRQLFWFSEPLSRLLL